MLSIWLSKFLVVGNLAHIEIMRKLLLEAFLFAALRIFGISHGSLKG